MAGNSRIQGITVEIGGDTGPLSKALQGVNKEIQGTQSQLKDVERLLKMDPGNTELLRQKQRLLGDAIGETKTKLEALKTAEQQAQAQFQKGEISQKQYDGLKREIADTEIKLKSLEKSYKDFGNVAGQVLQKASSEMKKFGDKTSEFGKKVEGAGKFFQPLSLAAAGVGVAAVKVGSDFDSAMSQVSAVSGASGKELEDLRDKAKQMGETTKFSATESAEAFNYMAMAGWKTNDMLDGIEGIMNLAAASGEDLATTSDIVTDALTAFGLQASDSAHFSDVIAQASSNANTNVGMMGETFKYVAPAAGAMGYSAEDVAVAVGLMANSGIKASQAGTALRGALTRLTKVPDPSKSDAGQWLQSLGLLIETDIGYATSAVQNIDGTVKPLKETLEILRDSFSSLSDSEKTQAATAIFGTEAMSGMLAILNASDSDFEELTDAVNNADGASKRMADTMNDNLAGQLTLMKSQLEGIGIKIAEILIPKIREILTVVSEWLTKFSNLDDGTLKLIITIGGIVAAISPVLLAGGKLLKVIGTLTSGFGSVVGIVGKVVGLFSGGGGLFAVFGAITGPVGIAVAAVGALVAIFGTLFATNEDFRNKVGEIWGQIQQIFSSVLEQIKGLIQGFVDVVNAIWQTYGSQIMDVISAAFDFVKTYIESALKVVKDVISVVMGLISGDWEKVWNGLKNLVSDVLGGVMNIINSWQQLVQKAFELLGSAVGNVLNALKGVILNIFEGMKTGALNSLNNLKSGAATVIGNVVTTIRNGLGKAVDYVKGLPSQFLGWGKDMIQGLINGIKSKIDAVGKAVGSVANKVKRFLHFSRPDEGPLRDYETWMPDFMSGLAAGIRQNASRVTQAVDALTRNMTINMQPMAFPAAASASGGTQTVTQPVSIAVNIDRLDNGSGQAPRAIAEQINSELQRIQQRSKAQW